MKLYIKFLLTLLPISIFSLAILGTWASHSVSEKQEQAMYDHMKVALKTYFSQAIQPRHRLLENNQLYDVPSYINRYQSEATADLNSITLPWKGYIMIFAGNEPVYPQKSGSLHAETIWDDVIQKTRKEPDFFLKGYSLQNQDLFVASYFPAWNWTLISVIPKNELSYAISGIRWITTLIVIGCAFLLIVTTSFLFLQLVSRPVERMLTFINKLPYLNQLPTLPATSDELGILSKELSSMGEKILTNRHQLEKWNRNLENQIMARTREIREYSAKLENELTQKIAAEQKMNLVQEALNCAADAIVISTPQGKLFYKNTTYEELFIHSSHNLDIQNQKIFKEVQETQKSWAGEVRIPTTGSNTIPCLLRVNPVHNCDNQPIAVIFTYSDLRKINEFKTALEKISTRFTLAMQGVRDGLWDLDLINQTVYLSPRWKKMLGYEDDELENTLNSWESLLHPEDQSSVTTEITDFIEKKKESPYVREFRMLHKKGHYVDILSRGVLVFPPGGGDPVRFIGTHIDQSKRKKAEKDLIRLNTELVRSNEELQQFAYVASHDLQEPLRMVSSYTQLLKDRYFDQLDDKANKFINYANEGAVRMQKLILDLLTFSRVQSRGQSLEPVATNTALHEALENLHFAIQKSKAIITSDPLPTVNGDLTQLTQLFQNLIANAIKFRTEAKPEISIRISDNATEWTFSVKDNGIGINEKYKDKVFILFQRLHSRTTYEGTGVGLALCQRIIFRHGGKIWLKSELGKGATFYFTLPKNTPNKELSAPIEHPIEKKELP